MRGFDLSVVMPLITPETASEMGKRSAATYYQRKAQREAELLKSVQMPVETEEKRRACVLAQIDQCDKLLKHCDDAKTFVALTAAKERLWNLVFPTAGVMRQRSSGRRGPGPASLPPPVPE